MKRGVASLVAFAVVALAVTASADPRPRNATVVTMKTIEIFGKRMAPIASIEVTKAAPSAALSELRQPFIDRIGDSVHSSSL